MSYLRPPKIPDRATFGVPTAPKVARSGRDSVARMGPLLVSGRDADVFAIDAHRVLRRYRDGSDVTAEAAVMRGVGAHGFPVPTVHSADGADLIMERLDGGTMMQALRLGELTPADAAGMLADLHTRLHAIPGPDPARRILHLDLHPENVMMSSRGPLVIDWRNAADGPPELDVALSALILAQLVVAGVSGRELLDAFVARTGDQTALGLEAAVERRRRDPNLTAREVDQLTAAAGLVS